MRRWIDHMRFMPRFRRSAAMFLSGALLFWSEAARLYPSYSYRVKFLFLFMLGINALLFHTTIYKSVDKWKNDAVTPFRAKMAGWIGISFWAVVIFCAAFSRVYTSRDR